MYAIKSKPEDFVVNEISNVKISEKGDYSVYKLKKINTNTQDAIQKIADFLKIPLKRIGYAGTKDKVAVTTQLISIKGSPNLENFNSENIELEYLGKSENPISLGDLEGNEFIITVRDTETKPKHIIKFKNLFGEQRFSKNNAEVGKALIKQDFKKTCELIENRKVEEALNKGPTNYIAALRSLPKKILMLYIHAYQSYLWNKVAERLEKDCKIPILGFGTEFEDEEIEQIYKALMKEENITLRDFIIKPLPDLSSEGDERDLYTEIKDLNIEEQQNKVILKFKLNKGCYATEAVKAILKIAK